MTVARGAGRVPAWGVLDVAYLAGFSGQPVSGLTLAVGLVAVVIGFGAWLCPQNLCPQNLCPQNHARPRVRDERPMEERACEA